MDRRALLAVALAVCLSLSGCVADLDTLGGEAGENTGTATEWTVDVVEVVDGDTLKVRFPDGRVENVRLLGVDTPEVHVAVSPDEFEGVPETDAGRAWLRDWGHKASEWMRQRVADAEITVRTDPTADRRGSYGRLLVYASVDGTDVNAQLLRQGYARLYESEFQRRDRYASLEAAARSQNAGIWGYDGASTDEDTATDDGGAVGSTGLAVATVHADAAGPDGDNLDDEYVVLENRGNRTIDLTDWTLRDTAGHTYAFPDGYELRPSEQVTVYTGSGTDTDSALYWGASAPYWNNDGDVLYVATENGTVVVEYEYG